VENAHDLQRLGRAMVNHQILSPHRPEKDGFLGQVWALVAEPGIVCQDFARIVHIHFELIGSRDVVGGDVTPDFLQVIFCLER